MFCLPGVHPDSYRDCVNLKDNLTNNVEKELLFQHK